MNKLFIKVDWATLEVISKKQVVMNKRANCSLCKVMRTEHSTELTQDYALNT